MSGSAREYHERLDKQVAAVGKLRMGARLNETDWRYVFNSRLPPVIDRLRNAHGLTIHGDGSVIAGEDPRKEGPYFMPYPRQMPMRVLVTEKIKAAYWGSPHWAGKREARMEIDCWRCLLCGDHDSLKVHHCVYRLFRESMFDLMTVCEWCHDRIHKAARLKFPSGMRVEDVRRLGIEPTFPPWLVIGAAR